GCAVGELVPGPGGAAFAPAPAARALRRGLAMGAARGLARAAAHGALWRRPVRAARLPFPSAEIPAGARARGIRTRRTAARAVACDRAAAGWKWLDRRNSCRAGACRPRGPGLRWISRRTA